MKRKTTKLESNLITLGYSLDHKTYCGKHSDKIEGYVYKKDNGVVIYFVKLNKTRERVDHLYFTTYSQYRVYDSGKLEGLEEVLANFALEIGDIYDFGTGETLDLVDFSQLENDFDNRVDYIEEAYFDD